MPYINLKKVLERGERGQSLVEMTIGFIILLTLLAGLLDLGRLYFTFIGLEDGAGEAALYAAINPKCFCEDGTACAGGAAVGDCGDPNNAAYRARHSGSKLVDWTAATTQIEFFCSGSCEGGDVALGDTIDVDISYDFELLTPLISNIAGGTNGKMTITAHASQSVVGDPD